MEAYILLLLFFLGLPLAIYLVLSDPNKSASLSAQDDSHDSKRQEAGSNTVSYAVLAALLVFFCVLTALAQRSRS